MICKAVRLLALENADVTALIGFRWTPVGEGQGTALPRVTHFLVDDVPTAPTQNGASGLAVARVQLNLLANDEAEAAELANVMRRTLVGRRTFSGGLRIESIFLAADHADYDPEPLVYKRVQDYKVTHSEAIA